MSLTLFGFGQSRSFRCLWALEEAGLSYQYRSLDLASDADAGAKSAQYMALNQQGKVPSLQHDDFVLTESAAILNYIDTLSEHSFVPLAAQARARYDELAFFVLSELEQPLWSMGKHRFAIPAQWRIEKMLDTAQWEFDKALKALSALISLDRFAIENRFSFADILVAQTINWADRFKLEVPHEYLNYRDSMYAREAAQRALAMVK